MASTRGAGSKGRLIATAALSMAAFGVVMTCLGASLQTVIARFGIDKAQAGALLSLLSFWILAGSVVFGPIVDRRGYRGMLILSFVAIIAGLELIAFAPSPAPAAGRRRGDRLCRRASEWRG